MKLFRQLNEEEEREFRAYARKTYTPFTPIEGIWHPVVQHECAEMNREADAQFLDTMFVDPLEEQP